IAVAEELGKAVSWQVWSNVSFWTGREWRLDGSHTLIIDGVRMCDVAMHPQAPGVGRFGAFAERNLPDYLNDPAAWGALLEKERIALAPNLRDTWWASWDATGRASSARTPGAAVCAA